jgi:hypothetical protein
MATRRYIALAALAFVAAACPAQERAAVDRTDPQAVVAAYMAALDAADSAAAAEVMAGDRQFREALIQVVREMNADMGVEGMTFGLMLAETTFLPFGLPAGERTMQVQVDEQEATVSVTERSESVRKFVLIRDDEGRWCVDLRRSITATTGLERSFLVDEMLTAFAAAGGEEAEPFPAEMAEWYRPSYVSSVASQLVEWADDHDGLLPPAESWLDDIESRRLWPDQMEQVAGQTNRYGIALNMALAGKALPQDEEGRAELVLVFECADFDRNMVGDPETELLPVGAEQPAPLIALASGEVLRVPFGLTPAEAAKHTRWSHRCRGNVTTLCSALLAYARNHEGRLPAGATWCDDIDPYLRRMEADADVFRCPAAPELQYGYALNEALAGTDVRMVQEPHGTILILPAEAGVRNEVRAVPATVVAGRHLGGDEQEGARAVIVGTLAGMVLSRPEGGPYEGGW